MLSRIVIIKFSCFTSIEALRFRYSFHSFIHSPTVNLLCTLYRTIGGIEVVGAFNSSHTDYAMGRKSIAKLLSIVKTHFRGGDNFCEMFIIYTNFITIERI